MRSRTIGSCSAALLTLALATPTLAAQTGTVETTPAPAPPAAPAVPPPPYSLPWQLRPAAVGNVLRLDTSIGFYKTPATAMAPAVTGGSTVASMLLATYKVTPTLAPILRLGVVQNDNPGPVMGSGAAFANPVVGLTGGWKLPAKLRLSAILAGTVPIGSGGTKTAAQNTEAAAIAKGAPVRSAMDNAMFAVNYLTGPGRRRPGLRRRRLHRPGRGDHVPALARAQRDLRRRHQQVRRRVDPHQRHRRPAPRLLHPPHPLGGRRDPLPAVAQARGHEVPRPRERLVRRRPPLPLQDGPHHLAAPGISYATFIDQPLSKSRYSIVQVDVPFAF
jgi:hypothetical protein